MLKEKDADTDLISRKIIIHKQSLNEDIFRQIKSETCHQKSYPKGNAKENISGKMKIIPMETSK